MALSIKDFETEQLAREQAALYGISITEAIRNALRVAQNANEKQRQEIITNKLQAVRKIQEEVKKQPGYNKLLADIKNLKKIRDDMWE